MLWFAVKPRERMQYLICYQNLSIVVSVHRAVQENRKGLGFKLTQGAWIETCHRALCIKMAADGKLFVRFCSLFVLLFVIVETKDEDADRAKEKEAAEKEKKYNAIDTVFLLVMMFLLIITVLTVWLFKVKRFRFLHETGVCMIYGKLVAPVVFQWIFILHCKVLDWLFLGDHVAHLEFVKTLLQFQFISYFAPFLQNEKKIELVVQTEKFLVVRFGFGMFSLLVYGSVWVIHLQNPGS